MNVIETSTWVLALAMINVFFSVARSVFFFSSFPSSLFLPPKQENITTTIFQKSSAFEVIYNFEYLI